MPEVENQGLELKRELNDFRDISKTVCAFANTVGGKVLIGVSNDGKTVGVPEKKLDEIQQRIEGTIQLLVSVPLHKIAVEEREGKKIISIEVYQIGQSAFCTFNGIVYYRSGSTNTKLEGRTLQDYLVKRQILSFDEQISKATIADIDLAKLAEFLKRRTPSLEFSEKKAEEYLVNLSVAQRNGTFSIKNTGAMFFAKEPEIFVPQNEMKLVRFKGTQSIDIIDSKFLRGNLPQNLSDAFEFVRKNIRTALKIEKLERVEVPEYPLSVIREALVNAVAHRDYFSRDAIQVNVFDDRIEFINPGTLPTGLSIKILGSLSIQRNPLTYRLMRDLGLIEGLATGIPRMRSEMAANGLPTPSFEELGSFFKVTLYNKISEDGDLNERQRRVIAYLSKNPMINSTKYTSLYGVSRPTAVSDLNELCKKGLLERVGKTRGAYYILAKKRI